MKKGGLNYNMGFNDRILYSGHIYRRLCPNCKKSFEVHEQEQVPGFRCVDELKCPYCGYVLRTSMEYEYMTYKLDKE